MARAIGGSDGTVRGYPVGMPVAFRRRPDGASTAAAVTSSLSDDLRSSVTFVRDDPSDCRQRQVFVRVDGDRRLVLVYGDSVEVELRPGMHHFFIHNTLFWKNVRIGIEPGEHLQCRVVNAGRWWTAGVVGVLGAAPLFLSVQMTGVSGVRLPESWGR